MTGKNRKHLKSYDIAAIVTALRRNLLLLYIFNIILKQEIVMSVKMKKSKANKVKPVRATVVEDPADWKKMWQAAFTPPTETQINRMKHLRQCFDS